MSFFGALIGGKAAEQAANYNAKLLERDAKIKEQEAKQSFAVYTKFDLPRFNDNAEKLRSQINTTFATSGVTYSGSVLEVLMENELNLERDRDMLKYNAEVDRDRKLNEAINTRAEANIERYKGKVARKVSYYQAGESLLTTAGMFV